MEITVRMQSASTFWAWDKLFYTIYFLGGIWFITQLVMGLKRIQLLIREGEQLTAEDFTWVFHQSISSPFSFFKYLFCSASYQFNSEERQKIQQHELAHIKGCHSVDVLIIELLTVSVLVSPTPISIQKILAPGT